MTNRINRSKIIQGPPSGRIRACRDEAILNNGKSGMKKKTNPGLTPEWIGRGKGMSKAEHLSSSKSVSGGFTQANWQALKSRSLSKRNHVHRDGWNKGSLVVWEKPKK